MRGECTHRLAPPSSEELIAVARCNIAFRRVFFCVEFVHQLRDPVKRASNGLWTDTKFDRNVRAYIGGGRVEDMSKEAALQVFLHAYPKCINTRITLVTGTA